MQGGNFGLHANDLGDVPCGASPGSSLQAAMDIRSISGRTLLRNSSLPQANRSLD